MKFKDITHKTIVNAKDRIKTLEELKEEGWMFDNKGDLSKKLFLSVKKKDLKILGESLDNITWKTGFSGENVQSKLWKEVFSVIMFNRVIYCDPDIFKWEKK